MSTVSTLLSCVIALSPWRYPTPQFDAIRAMRVLRHQAESLGMTVGASLSSSFSWWTLGCRWHCSTMRYRLRLVTKSMMRSRPDLGSSTRLFQPLIIVTKVQAESAWPQGVVEATRRRESGKWADPEYPANLLIHSIDDEGVPIANSYTFAMALADAGVPHQFHSVPSGRHG